MGGGVLHGAFFNFRDSRGNGNNDAGDGCGAGCAVESGYACEGEPSACATVCGDGIVAGTEECDDGNTASNDGCSASCEGETCTCQ